MFEHTTEHQERTAELEKGLNDFISDAVRWSGYLMVIALLGWLAGRFWPELGYDSIINYGFNWSPETLRYAVKEFFFGLVVVPFLLLTGSAGWYAYRVREKSYYWKNPLKQAWNLIALSAFLYIGVFQGTSYLLQTADLITGGWLATYASPVANLLPKYMSGSHWTVAITMFLGLSTLLGIQFTRKNVSLTIAFGCPALYACGVAASSGMGTAIGILLAFVCGVVFWDYVVLIATKIRERWTIGWVEEQKKDKK